MQPRNLNTSASVAEPEWKILHSLQQSNPILPTYQHSLSLPPYRRERTSRYGTVTISEPAPKFYHTLSSAQASAIFLFLLGLFAIWILAYDTNTGRGGGIASPYDDLDVLMNELGVPKRTMKRWAQYTPWMPTAKYIPPPVTCAISQVSLHFTPSAYHIHIFLRIVCSIWFTLPGACGEHPAPKS